MERTSETVRKKMSTHKPSEKNKFEAAFPFRCHHRTYHQPTMNPAEKENLRIPIVHSA